MRAWIAEQLEEINEQGKVSAFVLTHHDATGRDNELHAMRNEMKHWGDPDAMANAFDAIATRHARGLPGVQQMQMAAVFGTSTNASRFLPFQRSGALTFGPIPGGGLATEAPTPQGQAQQGMRMGEMVVQGMISWARPVFESAQQMIAYQGQQIVRLSEENRELFIALRDELAARIQLAHDRRMQELNFVRSTAERKRVLAMLPALANVMSGQEVFPQSTEDTTIIEQVAETLPEKDVRALAHLLGTKNPELAAIVLARFDKAEEKRDEEAEEHRRLSREVLGIDPEEDAAGNATKVLKKVGINADLATRKIAEEQNGTTEASTAPVEDHPNVKLARALFDSMNPIEVAMLAGHMSSKDPALAAMFKEQYNDYRESKS